MSDTASEATQADATDAPVLPPAGETTPVPAPEPAPITSPVDQEPESEDDLPITLRAARELRREHQQLRRDIDAAHAAREAAERRLSEIEPLAGQVETLRTTLKDAQVRAEVLSVAPTLNFANPDDALLFIRDAITTGPDGTTNIRPLLEELATAKPYLLNTPRSIASGAVTNVVRRSDPASVLDLDGLSPAEAARQLARLAGKNAR